MNLIQNAVRDVQYGIPREILRMAYLESQVGRSSRSIYGRVLSLDEAIREMTIVPRCIKDTNLVNGETAVLNLEGLAPIQLDNNNYVYFIPPDRTNNRTIMSCLSVSYFRSDLYAGYSFGSLPSIMPTPGADLTSSAARAMNSRQSIPVVSTSDCRVVAHNTIKIADQVRNVKVSEARCIMEHDENLQNLSPYSALPFTELCTYAVKSFIYNELYIGLDRGRIDRGHEIGTLKSKIDEYADAETNYQTFLKETWGGVVACSDRILVQDLLTLQIDPGI